MPARLSNAKARLRFQETLTAWLPMRYPGALRGVREHIKPARRRDQDQPRSR